MKGLHWIGLPMNFEGFHGNFPMRRNFEYLSLWLQEFHSHTNKSIKRIILKKLNQGIVFEKFLVRGRLQLVN